MTRFLIALQFITRIPVNKKLNYDQKLIAGSMIYYPVIGTLLGGILVLINYLGSLYLPKLVSNSLLLIVLITLTGGLHLDGFMDTIDGIFSGRKSEKIMEIMRDSRVGAFGVIALFCLLLLKFSLLVELPGEFKTKILLYFPTLGRWAMVYTAFGYPYAREEGLGKIYALYLNKKHIFLATIWTLGLGSVLFKLWGIILLAVSWVAVIVMAKFITGKINGLTGDSYGAINELVEVISLLVMLIIL